MFPGPGAQIHRNEEGEVLGWDYPAEDAAAYWCDYCGCTHGGECPDPSDEDDIFDELSEDDFDPDDWKENIDDDKIWQITRPEDATVDDDPD